MMTSPSLLKSKCVSRNPQTSSLSATFGSGVAAAWGMNNDPSARGAGGILLKNCSGIGCMRVVFKQRFYRNAQYSANSLADPSFGDVMRPTADLYADNCSFQRHQFMRVIQIIATHADL